MEYTVVICDDDVDQASNLALKIGIAAMMESGDTPDTKIQLKIGTIAQNYQKVTTYLDAHPISGGLYFLDIELSPNKQDPNGVDLAEQIKKRDPRAQIIFVTAYNEYMGMTYERRIGSVDYINKNNPNLQKRLNATLRDAINNLSTENFTKKMTFSYRIGRIIRNINIDDIFYITTTKAPHKLRLVYNEGEAEFVGDIKTVDEQNELLKKVSQSYLINPKNVTEINLRKRQIKFINGDLISFSRRFGHYMREMIQKYNLVQNNLTE